MSTAKPSTSSSPPPEARRTLQAKLFELRYHALVAALSAGAVFSFLRLGSGFAAVVSFFRPLLLSTAVFLIAIVVLLVISPLGHDVDGEKAGADLIDYVAGAAGAAEGGGEADEGDHQKAQ